MCGEKVSCIVQGRCLWNGEMKCGYDSLVCGSIGTDKIFLISACIQILRL